MTYQQLLEDILNFVTTHYQCFEIVECPSCAGDLESQTRYIIHEILSSLPSLFEEIEEEIGFDLTADRYAYMREAIHQGVEDIFANIAQANQGIGCLSDRSAWQERVQDLLTITLDSISHAAIWGYEPVDIDQT